MSESVSRPVAARRQQAIGETVAKIRDIEDEGGVSRESLEQMKSQLLTLAGRTELFPEDDFPSATDEPLMYLLSEDDDHRFALYLSTGRPGGGSPPHDHTTWAVIAGIEGEEENRVYDRCDDGSVPGHGEVRERERFVVKSGTAIAFMPSDVHSIHVIGETPTRNFHMYGKSIERLPERVMFDQDSGTTRSYAASRGIRK